jgi:putative component of membrane protein insertase Oxa1/YidC/SpoIIIJ protein YidD
MRFFLFFPLCLFAAGFQTPWGRDADILEPKKMQTIEDLSIFTKVADKIIVFHQKVLSPVDGPRSHFRPTSSKYMQLAMKKYGFLRGYIMGCDRLLRENDDPWVYRTIEIDGKLYKYDPASVDKF